MFYVRTGKFVELDYAYNVIERSTMLFDNTVFVTDADDDDDSIRTYNVLTGEAITHDIDFCEEDWPESVQGIDEFFVI